MSLSRSLLLVLLATGCATADRVQQLEEKVTALEQKVDQIEKSPGAASARPAATEASSAQEDAAKAVYGEMTEALNKGDLDTAKAKLEVLKTQYADTTAYKRAKKVEAELEVVGKTAPADWKGDIEKWYQGEGDVDITKGTTLVVFWEVWCPHCRKEVPALKETYEKFHGKGLQMAGFTRITRSATEEKVTEFLKQEAIPYPIAKENGKLADAFGVSGIPAAAVIKDGKVVWRGHPGRLNDDMINGWL